MKYLITGIIYFIIIYIFYYIFVVCLQKKKKYRKLSSDALILSTYYKINLKKVGYKRVYRVLNFVNSLLITFVALVVLNIKSMTLKLIIIIILIVPVIWVGYYVTAKYLSYLEKEND